MCLYKRQILVRMKNIRRYRPLLRIGDREVLDFIFKDGFDTYIPYLVAIVTVILNLQGIYL